MLASTVHTVRHLPAQDQKPGTTRTLLSGDGGAGAVRRTVLPGGLRVLTEEMPTVRSATFGIWVGVGSRDETPRLSGATHYLEHLLFKGTRKRDALQISAALDAVGGEMNAFTAKEYTCYYARVLDQDLPLAVDVISDMVTSSLIAKADVESERGVILEEIAMHDDDPGDAVHDQFTRALLGDSPACPATPSTATTGGGTRPPTSSSPPRATCAIATSSAWSGRRSGPPGRWGSRMRRRRPRGSATSGCARPAG
jgi:Insulinase (Peptidase family M16)